MSARAIRKLSVGTDQPNGVLHYQVGAKVSLGRDEENRKRFFEVSAIVEDRNYHPGQVAYDVYITNVVDDPRDIITERRWKSIVGVPLTIEYQILD